MKKNEFICRAKALSGLFRKALRSVIAVDSHFEKPLPYPVFFKLVERLKNNSEEEFVSKGNKLYVKDKEKHFYIASIDKTNESAILFGGKIILDSKNLQVKPAPDKARGFEPSSER